MSNNQNHQSIGQQNGNGELEQMVMNFRVYELQHLLGFANRCRSGKKPELLVRALELVRSTKNMAVQQKIRELARRVPERSFNMTSSSGEGSSSSSSVNAYVPSPPYPSPSSTVGAERYLTDRSLYPGYVSSSTSTSSNSNNAQATNHHHHQQVANPNSATAASILNHALRQKLPSHANVRLTSLPFYDVISEVAKPTTLIPMTNDKYQENFIPFSLTGAQMAEMAFNDSAPLPRVELQLRFCLLDTNSEQKDDFPSGCNVRLNEKLVQLPNPIPTNKIGVEPKRPSRPVNVTPYCRPHPNVQRIQVAWNHDGTRHWAASLYIVRHLTANILLNRLQAKGERPSSESVAMIQEKLSGDGDNDIATTSLRVSLLCPLGKMRMRLPCRLRQCNHLQCFDGELFLRMNEKKPTWTCPVCDKPSPFIDIQLDGYFMDVMEKTGDEESEVELYEDGSWAPIIEEEDCDPKVAERRKAPERNAGTNGFDSVSPVADRASSSSLRATSAETSTSSSTTKQCSNPMDNLSVIDLTEDDSDEEDDQPSTNARNADSRSSSINCALPARNTAWQNGQSRLGTQLSTMAMDSQSNSTSPSIIVLDSPPPSRTVLQTPEDPQEHVEESPLQRQLRLSAAAWNNEASSSTILTTCEGRSTSSSTNKSDPMAIRKSLSMVSSSSPQLQHQSSSSSSSTINNSALSQSPPKKRHAPAGVSRFVSSEATTPSSSSTSQSPSSQLAALSANDVSAALMASSFLNGSSAAASSSSSTSSNNHYHQQYYNHHHQSMMAAAAAHNFGCGIPLLSAVPGMDYADPNDPFGFGRLLANNTYHGMQQQHQQQQQQQQHHQQSASAMAAAVSNYNNMYLPSTSNAQSPSSSSSSTTNNLYGSLPRNYFMNSMTAAGSFGAQPYAAVAAAAAAANGGISTNDFISAATNSAAALAMSAGAIPGDSIWDNRWGEDFQAFLNSRLGPDSSRST